MELIKKLVEDYDLAVKIWSILRSCWSALGVVYLLGRMLEIIKTHRAKNTVASICILFNIAGMFYFPTHAIYNIYIYSTIGYTVYVWILWRSADRMDSYLDKKGLKDKGFKPQRRKS